MIVFAVDPGSKYNGWVLYDSEVHRVIDFDIDSNDEMLKHVKYFKGVAGIFVYEMIGHFGTGMAVGDDVFETCVNIGHYEEAWGNKPTIFRILNREVRLTLCGTTRAKEANIHLSAKQKFEPIGGGSDPYKGVKSQPGPLYGMKSHAFSALAVALTWKEMYGKKE